MAVAGQSGDQRPAHHEALPCWPGPPSCPPPAPPRCPASPALPTIAETTMSTSSSVTTPGTASGPTRSSASRGRADQSWARGGVRIGHDDPPGPKRPGLASQQLRVAMGRQRHRLEPPLGGGNHLQRAAADAPGRAKYRHARRSVGHGRSGGESLGVGRVPSRQREPIARPAATGGTQPPFYKGMSPPATRLVVRIRVHPRSFTVPSRLATSSLSRIRRPVVSLK